MEYIHASWDAATLMLPSTVFDFEYLIITYWWVFLVVACVFIGIAEYTRVHWQAWCDRRRLQMFREQCELRQAIRHVMRRQYSCGNGTAAAEAAPEGGDAAQQATPQQQPQQANGHAAAAGGSVTPITPPSSGSAAGHSAFDSAPPRSPALRPVSPASSSAAAAHRERGAGGSPALPGGEDMDGRSSSGFATATTSPSHVPALASIAPASVFAMLSSGKTPLSPDMQSNDDGEGSLVNGMSQASSQSGSFPMANSCFPRYSADEQRSMELRRQANENDWLEARRALENTDSVTCRGTGAGNDGDAEEHAWGASLTDSSTRRRRPRRAG